MKKMATMILAIAMTFSLAITASAVEVPDDFTCYEEAMANGLSFALADENNSGYENAQENIMVDPMEELLGPKLHDILQEKTRNVYSANNYDGYSLNWESNGYSDILHTVSKPNLMVTYNYNDDDFRISKTVNGITTSFSYGTVRGVPDTLISENRDGVVINYTFDIDPVGSTARSVPSGFEINGTNYQLIFDSSDIVSGISNENGNQIVQYEYTDGIVSSILELNENGDWMDVSDSSDSIGVINKIRYLGYYFDDETGWYYSDSYYDATGERFIDGDISASQEGTNSVATDVDDLYDQCINDTSFGRPISSTSSTWYSSLETVEIVARLIYGENTFDWSNGYDRENERKAEGWVLFNRVGAPGIRGNSSLRNVCTASDQFSTISGGGSYDAKNPVRSKDAWKEAVYIACCLVTTSDRSTLNSLIPRPTGISDQLFLYALYNFKNEYSTTSSGLRHGGHDLEDVTIVDISWNITNSSIIEGTADPKTHNIFYNWAN